MRALERSRSRSRSHTREHSRSWVDKRIGRGVNNFELVHYDIQTQQSVMQLYLYLNGG